MIRCRRILGLQLDIPAIESRRGPKKENLDPGQTRRQERVEPYYSLVLFRPLRVPNQNRLPQKFPHSIGAKILLRVHPHRAQFDRSIREMSDVRSFPRQAVGSLLGTRISQTLAPNSWRGAPLRQNYKKCEKMLAFLSCARKMKD